MTNCHDASDSMHLLSRGAGTPVLFLHGMPTSSRLWNGVIQGMLHQHTCLAVDLPGLGRTPRNQYGFEKPNKLAAAIENIRIKCNIEKWHVVGHDAGCAVAVHYAHQFQHRVERLALLSPSMFPDLKPFFLFEILRTPVIGELTAPAISLLFWRLVMKRAVGRHENTDDVVREFQSPFCGFRGAWRLMSLMRWGNPKDVLAAIPIMLPDLLMPTQIFHGLNDRAVPKEFANRSKSLIPNSEVILLDAGHFVPLDEPQLIAKELCRFFASPFSPPRAEVAMGVHQLDFPESLGSCVELV
jgi:pimeloyl-ACP methyl ester carboxylesterase